MLRKKKKDVKTKLPFKGYYFSNTGKELGF